MKLEFNLPQFDGFYHSLLDISDYLEHSVGDDEDIHLMTESDYDSINWNETETKISKRYLDVWIEKNTEVLESFGLSKIQFKDIDRPREYNFTTDKCVCTVTFNKSKFITLAREHIQANRTEFEQFLQDNYKSYDGFCSFYAHDFDTWNGAYMNDEFDNVIFEGLLQFICEPLTDDEKTNDVLENWYEMIEYNN